MGSTRSTAWKIEGVQEAPFRAACTGGKPCSSVTIRKGRTAFQKDHHNLLESPSLPLSHGYLESHCNKPNGTQAVMVMVVR